MKRYRLIVSLLICLVVICTACNTERTNESIPELPTALEECDFSLMDIASDLIIIPLGSETIMGSIREIKYIDPFFLIKTSDHKLYRVAKDGSIFDILDKKGRGPEEYLGITSFHVNSNGDVIISTATEKHVMIYSDSLNFLRYIPYPKDVEESYMYWVNDTPYFFPLPIAKTSKYDWISIDYEGNILDSRKYTGLGIKTIFTSEGSLQLFGNSEKFYRYRETSDTIFEMDKNGYRPVYTINRIFDDGLRMLTIEEATRDIKSVAEVTEISSINGRRIIEKIFDLGLNWIIHYRSEKCETVLLNRKENKSYIIGSGKYLPKLHNDIVGAGDIWIRGVIEMNYEKYILSYLDAFDFMSLVESEAFINGEPLLPSKKKEMQILAEKLSENDNPILMLLKLK